MKNKDKDKKDKPNDAEYDEEDNQPKDMTEEPEAKEDMKALVQEAIKDMISEEVNKVSQPLIEKVETVSKMANDYKTEYERLRKDMEAKDTKEAEDMKELLEKEPYGYAKDFLAELPLEKLLDIKGTFEASKAYKDFQTTQEEANKPNKEIFEDFSAIDDMLERNVSGYWGHLYGGKAV